MICMLKGAQDSAIMASTQAVDRIKSIAVTAPAELRESLDGPSTAVPARSVQAVPSGSSGQSHGGCQVHPGLAGLLLPSTQRGGSYPGSRAKAAHPNDLPNIVSIFGVGPDTAATLWVTDGSNAERLRCGASFAALYGVSPIPAFSGETNRHRLNRCGGRQAKAVLNRIAVVRRGYDYRSKTYMRLRIWEGMSKIKVVRCLKRYIAREVFTVLGVPRNNGRYPAWTGRGRKERYGVSRRSTDRRDPMWGLCRICTAKSDDAIRVDICIAVISLE